MNRTVVTEPSVITRGQPRKKKGENNYSVVLLIIKTFRFDNKYDFDSQACF